MVTVTDEFGREEAEPRKVECWDGGRVIRIIDPDTGVSEVWDGDELRAAVEPRREVRAA